MEAFERMREDAVIDTNVLVSALFSFSGNSNPSIIIRKIIYGVITPLYNEEILGEYEEGKPISTG